MPASTILNMITSFLKPTESIAVWLLAIGMVYNAYALTQLTASVSDGVHRAGTDYAFNVIEYGLKDLSSQDQIVEQVKKWHADKWGAQIGAIETICHYTPNRLEALVDKDAALVLCRIAK